MNLNLLFNYVILIVFNLLCYIKCSEQPKISIKNGNLEFSVGEDHHIYFKTKGKGFVHVNGNRIRTSESQELSQHLQLLEDKLNKAIEDSAKISKTTITVPSVNESILNDLHTRLHNLEKYTQHFKQLEELLKRNECHDDSCENGAQCIDLFNNYLCLCPSNWEGQKCDVDVNECAIFAGTDLGCQNGATCHNTRGSYECTCPTGWGGLHCIQRTANCTTGNPQELCGHGVCEPQNNIYGYTCICEQGWKTTGGHPACTVDVDECATSTYCSTNPPVQCVNLPGSFRCGPCPVGYTGNGHYCEDINECQSDNGGCSVYPYVSCTNTPGSRVCGPCPPGSYGDGVICSFKRSACRVNNGGCNKLAQCVDNSAISETYIKCICPQGYTGQGFGPSGCSAIDTNKTLEGICKSNPCRPHGTCTEPSPGRFKCTCRDNFVGRSCTIIDPCLSKPCMNGATCTTTDFGTFICMCPSNYEGIRCEDEKQACGGYQKSQTGNLRYPSSSSSVSQSKTSCGWTIETNSSLILNVTFLEFEINQCNEGSLSLYDGRNSHSKLIGHFCGFHHPPSPLLTSHEYLYLLLNLRRNRETTSEGNIALSWHSIAPICGASDAVIPVDKHGSLISPGSPGSYPPKRDCQWHLQARPGKRIRFTFFKMKLVTEKKCSDDGDKDYLEIRDNPRDSSILVKFCRSSQPLPYTTPGNEAFVKFHSADIPRSSNSPSNAGFQMAYDIVEGIPGCGGMFTANKGVIKYPSNTEGFGINEMVCEYQIQLPSDFKVKLIFEEMSLHTSCRASELEIREGSQIDSPLALRFCDTKTQTPHISNGNEVLIMYKENLDEKTNNNFEIWYESICGGYYNRTTGKITSPNYPMPYPFDIKCVYSIETPQHTAIILTFNEIMLDIESKKCDTGDYIQVYDGDSDESHILKSYCGNHSFIFPVTSTHNYVTIVFESDNTMSGRGFEVTWESIYIGCGGIKKENGILESPKSMEVVTDSIIKDNAIRCVWTLIAPPGNVVILTWISFNLAVSRNCANDYVEIYSNATMYSTNSNDTDQLLGRYCGTTLPSKIISPSRVMTVITNHVPSRSYSAAFTFSDQSQICGGTMLSPNGVIRSPEYSDILDCTWNIQVQPRYQIELNVTEFDIESNDNCNYNFLEIRNGGYKTSPLIGKFCGTTIPPVFTSHSNQLYLHFYSDGSHSSKGFKIYWTTSLGCGGKLTSSKGHLVSPNYPSAECDWSISTSVGSLIQIIMIQIELESDNYCSINYIEFYNVIKNSKKAIGRYCNNNHPLFITSNSNQMLIKFKSVALYKQRVFEIKYLTVCNNTIKGLYHGAIESPNYPNQCLDKLDCMWVISVPNGNKINITFYELEIDKKNQYVYKPPTDNPMECPHDYLEISEGKDEKTPVRSLIKLCGDKTPDNIIASSMNFVFIHFVTYTFDSMSKFRLEWILNGCGGKLTHPNGVIKSPNYPNSYPSGTVCEWVIEVDLGKSIMFTVHDISLKNCHRDVLSVYGGPDMNSSKIADFCKPNKNMNITSSFNLMYVQFYSDSTYYSSGRGFSASYETRTNCGGPNTALTGFIHSRNYPQNYNKDDDCRWLIQVPESYKINLTFVNFNIESSINCTHDYVKVYDGGSIEDKELLSYCGHKLPNNPVILSTSNKLTVRMKTNDNKEYKGFRAMYSEACGQRIVTNGTGTIQILEHTLLRESCSWTIISGVPEDHVYLTITHIEVDFCVKKSGIFVYDGEDSEAPLLNHYCKEIEHPTIVSNGNALHIKKAMFVTRFIAKYTVIGTSCGDQLASSKGYFASPGYPNSYPINVECEWLIKPSLGNSFELRFMDFKLDSSEMCNEDYVELREESALGKLIGVFCGSEIPKGIVIKQKGYWIKFKSNENTVEKGFKAYYEMLHHNELTGSKGRIQSPLYPLHYLNGPKFTWRITVLNDEHIRITFSKFTINGLFSNECKYYGLEIFDGYDNTASSLSKSCGHDIPHPVTSSSNVVFIEFITKRFSYESLFDFEWLAIPQTISEPNKTKIADCGSDEVFNINGIHNYTLTSPGYPHGYSENLKCDWIFSTIDSEHIVVEFDKLDLEDDKNCADAVSIYSGGSEKAWTKIGTYCHPNVSEIGKIHGTNLLKIVFESNFYGNKTGFSAKVFSVCGGSLEGSDGVIEIKNFTLNLDSMYDFIGEIDCKWNITVKPGRKINITFEYFEMGGNEDCKNKYIMFKNGKYEDSPLLGRGKYCGNTKPDLPLTTGNIMNIELLADIPIMGLKLIYKEVSTACGEKILLSNLLKSSEITTPNYPNAPPAHIECVWIVTVPAGDSVQLDFLGFDISETKKCAKAGVEIRDGTTRNSPLIKVLCSKMPGTEKTPGNFMYIRYYTDVSDTRNGFKAKVSIADCGGIIRAKKGFIKSTDINDIKKNTICTWYIVGPTYHTLTFTVTDLNLPMNVNCSLVANVLIKEKDFINNTDRILKQFCGNEKPDLIKTSSNKATVEFNSAGKDWPFQDNFILSFNTTKRECGEVITSLEGILTSPGYPSGHFDIKYCHWRFKDLARRRIKFELLDIDFKPDRQALVFSDEHNYHLIIRYNSSNKVLYSTGNNIYVYYLCDGTSQHRGFKLKYSSDEPSLCEGDLNQQSGTISPSLALYNEVSYFCQWTQTSTELMFESDEEPIMQSNQTLALTFIINGSIGPTGSHSCRRMSNIVVTGGATDEKLSVLCGNYSKPVVVRSPFPETKIKVTQLQSYEKLNYTINYTKYPCGGYLEGSSLTITSNNYPRPYKNNIDCAWVIKGPEGENFDIIFKTLDMDTSCENNYLSIHNGPLPSSPTLGKFCGNTNQSNIRSQSNELWIEYHAIETTVERKGFKMNLNSIQSGCGGVYHNEEKMIMSPNFPKSYPNDAECVWEVVAPNGNHIGLEFVDRFQLEESVDCMSDYIEVWDYVDESWNSLGKACGRNPPSINSSSNRMKIKFRSNSAISGNGFKAKWHLNCGGVLTPDEKIRTIVSPNYPNGYADDLYCKYTIASEGNYINVLFTDFKLEEGPTGCKYDNVTISTHSQNVYCGENKPPKIRNRNSVEIVFQSDLYISKRGFSFTYHIDHCGGIITTPTQIGTPSDDIEYYKSIKCVWNITAPEGKIVVVKFSTFELEFDADCSYDSVAIYDGNDISTSRRLALLCGKIQPPSLRSTSNSMAIQFTSDGSHSFKGFKASVMFTYGESSGCGGTIDLSENKKKVTIKSPNITEDGLYPPYLECHWLVSVPLGSNIKMSFKKFHVSQCIDANSTECNCDYLEVFDGAGPLSESISKMCGHNIPSEISSSFSNLWIKFVSDGASKTRSTGFTADVELITSICGNFTRNVTNSTQVLMSPNYPSKYPPNTRCTWYLYSETEHTKFDIHFEFLDLEEANSEGICANDKIEIYDKNDSPSTKDRLGPELIHGGTRSQNRPLSFYLRNRYPVRKLIVCGKNKNIDYYSGGRQVVIQFTSDSAKEFKGFKINYRMTGCNRNFTEIQGRIHNEDVKGHCFITITVPENRTISVFFQSFILFDTTECASAALVVRDGLTTDARQLAKLCGVLSPNPIFSTGNTLSFEIWNRREGSLGAYDIIYSSTDQGQACGGTLYNYSGMLSSPFYPGNYRNASDCLWHISTPYGTVVVLKFTTFDLGFDSTCKTDYVELLDVNPDTMDSEVRAKYCSYDKTDVFQARSNYMIVRTVSSVNNGGTGWMAKYVAKGRN